MQIAAEHQHVLDLVEISWSLKKDAVLACCFV